MSQVKVRAEDVIIGYRTRAEPGYLVAVESLNLQIEEGSFVSIVGRSGCGKSTFLHTLHGLHDVAAGRLTIDGEPVVKPSPDRSLVFQHAALFPWKTVRGNVEYGLRIQKRADQDIDARVDEMITLVGLEGFEDSYPHELSGGMQQRANLARALALDPSLVLMDEPFGALDALTRSRMQNELMDIWQSDQAHSSGQRRTAIFITHDIQEAVYLSDTIFVFSPRPGRLRERVDVTLPRPRDETVQRSPAFLDYVDRVTAAVYA